MTLKYGIYLIRFIVDRTTQIYYLIGIKAS